MTDMCCFSWHLLLIPANVSRSFSFFSSVPWLQWKPTRADKAPPNGGSKEPMLFAEHKKTDSRATARSRVYHAWSVVNLPLYIRTLSFTLAGVKSVRHTSNQIYSLCQQRRSRQICRINEVSFEFFLCAQNGEFPNKIHDLIAESGRLTNQSAELVA